MDRQDCQRLDENCALKHTRDRFALPEDVLYFDGNSLGALPKSTSTDVTKAIEEEWGEGLIKSWLDADWFFLSAQAGDAIAPLIGASAGEVTVSDSTSINIFKLAAALLRQSDGRQKVITERGNFPTDAYILEGIIELLDKDHELILTEPEQIIDGIDDQTALVLLTHTNYRSGRMHDMAGITAKCKAHDVPVIWDLCHSAGAVPLALNEWGVDYAIGCTYKFLNSGPGAPAFSYVSKAAIKSFKPVVTGWFSHRNQFGFEDGYQAAESINKCLVGSPQILSLRGVINGIKSFKGISMAELRAKSIALADLFIKLADERLAKFGLELASPREANSRASQVSFNHPEAYAICKTLIDRNVIPDFREPNILRFGITPLYMRYTDVWDVIDILDDIMTTSAWREFKTTEKGAVT